MRFPGGRERVIIHCLRKTLTKDPQQVWQTLKNFDYPIDNRLNSKKCHSAHHIIFLYSINLRFYHQSERFTQNNLHYPRNMNLPLNFVQFMGYSLYLISVFSVYTKLETFSSPTPHFTLQKEYILRKSDSLHNVFC